MSGYSRQTWTAFVAAAVFVATAAVLALVPVPYVTWAPGSAHDVLAGGDNPVIRIEGVATYPTDGSLDLTTLSVTRADSQLSLPEALLAYWMPSRDILPRDSVYRPGRTADEVQANEQRLMQDSKADAVVAALRQARMPVRELPMVSSVTIGAPAHGELQPGDLIEKVDGEPVTSSTQIRDAIRAHDVGDTIAFTVLRSKVSKEIRIVTVASNQDARTPVIGVTFATGYDYAPTVDFAIDPEIGGPSAGLVFALGVYDRITPGPLVGERTVAGTGTIDATGRVGPIGGAREKLESAEANGATVFLLPAGNCADLEGVQTHVTVIKVSTLDDAVRALKATADPPEASPTDIAKVERCTP